MTDRGDPELSAEVNVVVYVDGIDDNGPEWTPPENGNYVVGMLTVEKENNNYHSFMYL